MIRFIDIIWLRLFLADFSIASSWVLIQKILYTSDNCFSGKIDDYQRFCTSYFFAGIFDGICVGAVVFRQVGIVKWV